MKKSSSEQKGADGKQSKILAKIIERRNIGCRKVDIIPLCQDYLKLAIEYGNNFGNTKYTLNYMLRTHKDQEVVFNKITSAQNMQELAQAITMDDFYSKMVSRQPSLQSYFDNTFYK